MIPGLGVTQLLWFAGAYVQPDILVAPLEPWRMITTMFVHSPFNIQVPTTIFHILFNMYSLFIFGSVLERAIGRGRFLALYLIAGLGGSVAVDLVAHPLQPVVGASGAIFGLMGAFFVIHRRFGGNSTQLFVVIGLNLVIGFVVPGIAWEAHVGGLITGILVGLIYVGTPSHHQRNQRIALLAGLVLVLCLIVVARALIW